MVRPKADEPGILASVWGGRREESIDFSPLAFSSFAHADAKINLSVAPSKETVLAGTLVDARANVADVLKNERHSVNDQVSLQKATRRIVSRALCGNFVEIQVLSRNNLARKERILARKALRGATQFVPRQIASAGAMQWEVMSPQSRRRSHVFPA